MSESVSNVFAELEGEIEELSEQSEVSLGDVGRLANTMVSRMREVESAEAELKTAKEELRQIQEELLPQAMSSLGLSQLKLETGEKLTVSHYYQASIPPEHRESAFDWLHDNGHGDIIKHNVSVDFKKGEGEQAQLALEKLNDIGLSPKDEIKVAPMTLKAFVREEIEAGRELPPEFNVYVGQKATIKR
jgi:hypothetical protein